MFRHLDDVGVVASLQGENVVGVKRKGQDFGWYKLSLFGWLEEYLLVNCKLWRTMGVSLIVIGIEEEATIIVKIEDGTCC